MNGESKLCSVERILMGEETQPMLAGFGVTGIMLIGIHCNPRGGKYRWLSGGSARTDFRRVEKALADRRKGDG